MRQDSLQCGVDRVIPEKPDILNGLPHYISGLTITGDSNMKKIPLTQGQFALVDDGDYAYLMQWKWYAHWDTNTFYAVRKSPKTGPGDSRQLIRMHREILKAGKGQMVDHMDGNGLDNRRQNIRFCSHSQNNYNYANYPHSSKYKGVSWKTARGKWYAGIRHEGKHIFIGLYVNEDEAGRAYDKKAKELFGEFARLNNV